MDTNWEMATSSPESELESTATSSMADVQVIETNTPQLDELATKLGTSYKQLWGTLTLWANGKVPESLVRNSIVRMRNSTNAFVQACATHSIDCADLPPNTEFAVALVEHCLTQPAAPAVADTYSKIIREHGTPFALFKLTTEKVAIWREKTGLPAVPAVMASHH